MYRTFRGLWCQSKRFQRPAQVRIELAVFRPMCLVDQHEDVVVVGQLRMVASLLGVHLFTKLLHGRHDRPAAAHPQQVA